MKPFGRTPSGAAAHLFTLENSRGFRAEITDFGGAVVRLYAPDRHGDFADVVLGCDSAEDYAEQKAFLGALIGRYGNRIARGKFSLDGIDYSLTCNNHPAGKPCHLHGGAGGFDRVLWRSEA